MESFYTQFDASVIKCLLLETPGAYAAKRFVDLHDRITTCAEVHGVLLVEQSEFTYPFLNTTEWTDHPRRGAIIKAQAVKLLSTIEKLVGCDNVDWDPDSR